MLNTKLPIKRTEQEDTVNLSVIKHGLQLWSDGHTIIPEAVRWSGRDLVLVCGDWNQYRQTQEMHKKMNLKSHEETRRLPGHKVKQTQCQTEDEVKAGGLYGQELMSRVEIPEENDNWEQVRAGAEEQNPTEEEWTDDTGNTGGINWNTEEPDLIITNTKSYQKQSKRHRSWQIWTSSSVFRNKSLWFLLFSGSTARVLEWSFIEWKFVQNKNPWACLWSWRRRQICI